LLNKPKTYNPFHINNSPLIKNTSNMSFKVSKYADGEFLQVVSTAGFTTSEIDDIAPWIVEFFEEQLWRGTTIYTPIVVNTPIVGSVPESARKSVIKSLARPESVTRGSDNNRRVKKKNQSPGGIRKERRTPSYHRKPAMPRPLTQEQHERHAILLMHRVLSPRTQTSPFTLILDDLNQSAAPFTSELIRRAFSQNVHVFKLAFESKASHSAISHIPAYGPQNAEQILADLDSAMANHHKSLVVIDSMYDLINVKGMEMSAIFNLVTMKYNSCLVGVWHQDLVTRTDPEQVYIPAPLKRTIFMATTIITCKSFAHALADKVAEERSLARPTRGLLNAAEGVVQSMHANDTRGIVLEAEFRRKSGRDESETYFLRTTMATDYNDPPQGMVLGALKQEFVTLIDMVPAYNDKETIELIQLAGDDMDTTFNLDLTDKQKQARQEVVPPYFDAQKQMGEAGEGGRILYDMGPEDDFDEEEDEI
jgi:elongator complex protein 5